MYSKYLSLCLLDGIYRNSNSNCHFSDFSDSPSLGISRDIGRPYLLRVILTLTYTLMEAVVQGRGGEGEKRKRKNKKKKSSLYIGGYILV